jgi:hypothetical protein
MRRVSLLALLCVACTRDNPAFDLRPLAEEGTEAGSDEGEPVACEFQPTDGLSLRVGGLINFGGTCAGGVNAGLKVVSATGGELVAEVCAHGCEPCYASMLTISAYPLELENYIPMTPGECVSIEAGVSLFEEADACYFGGLTLYEHEPLAPYVIATAHSSEPTPMGAAMLGSSIPAPVKAGTCNCDDVGQGNDCCYMAASPPEFWAYPLDGMQLFPGDYAPLAVPNQLGLTHVFKPFQAQVLHACEDAQRQLSWAVVAVL